MTTLQATPLSRLERHIRLAGMLTAAGLAVCALTLLKIHPLAFMAFATVGAGLVLLGVLLVAVALITVPAETPAAVMLRDGRLREFRARILLDSLLEAAAERPIPLAALQRLVSDLEQAARQAEGRQIASTAIARQVLGRLWGLDQVAAIRYAARHGGVENLADLERELNAAGAAGAAAGAGAPLPRAEVEPE